LGKKIGKEDFIANPTQQTIALPLRMMTSMGPFELVFLGYLVAHVFGVFVLGRYLLNQFGY
jgi:hypothetical protein